MKQIVWIGILFLALLLPVNASNSSIPFNGRLLDVLGNPVSGSHSVAFSIYSQPSAGSLLWRETQTISVSDGYFSAMLGDANSLKAIDFSQEHWLGISIDNDAEMSPRTKTPSSLSAISAASLNDTDVRLYRSAPNTLKTEGSIFAADSLATDGLIYGAGLRFNVPAATNAGFEFYNTNLSALKWGFAYNSASDALNIHHYTDAGAYDGVKMALTSAGQLQLPTASTAAGLLFGTDTKLYRSAANTLRTDGSLFVNGNVGIGYTPKAKLTVGGQMYIAEGNRFWSIGTGRTNGPGGNATDTGAIDNSGSFAIRDTWRQTDALRINTSGNVGIGYTPKAKLTIGGQMYIAEGSRFWSIGAGRTNGPGGNAPDTGAVTNDGSFAIRDTWRQTDTLRINTSGNVGIGTANPTQKLEISGVMKLTPTDAPGTCNAGAEGSVYADNSLNEPCYCNGANWKQFDGGGNC